MAAKKRRRRWRAVEAPTDWAAVYAECKAGIEAVFKRPWSELWRVVARYEIDAIRQRFAAEAIRDFAVAADRVLRAARNLPDDGVGTIALLKQLAPAVEALDIEALPSPPPRTRRSKRTLLIEHLLTLFSRKQLTARTLAHLSLLVDRPAKKGPRSATVEEVISREADSMGKALARVLARRSNR
ncbi:MAG: hypothetical protein U0270_07720 [Labilithrix sp.]